MLTGTGKMGYKSVIYVVSHTAALLRRLCEPMYNYNVLQMYNDYIES